LDNLIGITIKPNSQKLFVIESVKRGDSTVFMADFFIEYGFIPENNFLRLIHKGLNKIGINKTFAGSCFRLEQGQISDIFFPESLENFEKIASNKFIQKDLAGKYIVFDPRPNKLSKIRYEVEQERY
jgi:hypothetical protein